MPLHYGWGREAMRGKAKQDVSPKEMLVRIQPPAWCWEGMNPSRLALLECYLRDSVQGWRLLAGALLLSWRQPGFW